MPVSPALRGVREDRESDRDRDEAAYPGKALQAMFEVQLVQLQKEFKEEIREGMSLCRSRSTR